MKMELELEQVARQAIEQPGVLGYLCIDKDGLCVTSKGQANESMSGLIRQIADLACQIEDPHSKEKRPIAIKLDMERQKILIQNQGDIATALIIDRD